MVDTQKPHQAEAGQPIIFLLSRLWQHLSSLRRKQYILLLCLMMLALFAKLLSIGSELPFLIALTQPRVVFDSPIVQLVLLLFGVSSGSQLIVALTTLFFIATTFACLVRMSLLWTPTRLSFAVGSDVNNQVYRTTLYQPYSLHIARNSSEVVNTIRGKVSEVIFCILVPAMSLVTSSIVALVICGVLVWVMPGTALSALGILLVAYVMTAKTSRRRLKTNNIRIAQDTTEVIKTFKEGLEGTGGILINSSQSDFAATYHDVNRTLRHAQGKNQLISQGLCHLLKFMNRLLIATLPRPLYKNADVIEFGQATTALDNNIKQSIRDTIEQLRRSAALLISAHRLNTLNECSEIIKVGTGNVHRKTPLSDFVRLATQWANHNRLSRTPPCLQTCRMNP
jgi:ABC-type bacteriocin/lantibiotic exporter with double-glycine peptidase domain